jgi:hypothetical protein
MVCAVIVPVVVKLPVIATAPLMFCCPTKLLEPVFANVVLSLLSNRSLLAAYDDVVATKAYDAEIAFPADPLIEPNTVRLPVIIEDPDTMAEPVATKLCINICYLFFKIYFNIGIGVIVF